MKIKHQRKTYFPYLLVYKVSDQTVQYDYLSKQFHYVKWSWEHSDFSHESSISFLLRLTALNDTE